MSKDLFHLGAGQNHRELGRFFGSLDLLQPTDLVLEHFFIEEKQRAERLILGRSRDVHVSREVREEPRHFLFPHFSGMTFAMEKDEALNPIDVSLLGANALKDPFFGPNSR